MPSSLHEGFLLLFRNRPRLAAELLADVVHFDLPEYSEVRIESAQLTDLQPAEYRADLVVVLSEESPVLGIVVEVQLGIDERKRYSWPLYVAGLRNRIRCPVCLLVVVAEDSVAKWAAQPINLGGASRLVPLVLGPSAIPEVTDEESARQDPSFAVLSAMAHGHDRNTDKALQIALAAIRASLGLDEERAALYFDLVEASLSEAVRKALQSMDPAQYEYQSEFARRYFDQGKAEGRAEGEAKGEAKGEARGRVQLLLKLLTSRFGELSDETRLRIESASATEIEVFAERVLRESSLEDVLRLP